MDEQMNILDRIHASYYQLSAAERKVADYVLGHHDQVQFMSITQLAEECGIAEATANIDTETELLIQDSLEKMKNIGTMLIVAHRLSTIQHCDNIILLDQGRIIEQGKHRIDYFCYNSIGEKRSQEGHKRIKNHHSASKRSEPT